MKVFLNSAVHFLACFTYKPSIRLGCAPCCTAAAADRSLPTRRRAPSTVSGLPLPTSTCDIESHASEHNTLVVKSTEQREAFFVTCVCRSSFSNASTPRARKRCDFGGGVRVRARRRCCCRRHRWNVGDDCELRSTWCFRSTFRRRRLVAERFVAVVVCITRRLLLLLLLLIAFQDLVAQEEKHLALLRGAL